MRSMISVKKEKLFKSAVSPQSMAVKGREWGWRGLCSRPQGGQDSPQLMAVKGRGGGGGCVVEEGRIVHS